MEMLIAEIDNLNFKTVENIILEHYKMGEQDNMSKSRVLTEEFDEILYICGTHKYGEFCIKIHKLDKGYLLSVQDYSLENKEDVIKEREYLYVKLLSKQFKFESINSCVKEATKSNFKSMFMELNIITIDKKEFYRARKIDLDEDVHTNKGICINKNGFVCGFNEENSGVPEKCKCKPGRLNKKGEQVLYIADDPVTAMLEIKSEIRDYISLAEFKIKKEFRILDLSANTKEDMDNIFAQFTISKFSTKGMSVRALFIELQMYLTMPNFSEYGYCVSNTIGDILKEMSIDGIKYKSFYSSGNNFALWKFSKKDIEFVKSKVYNNYCVGTTFMSVCDNQNIDSNQYYEKEIMNANKESIKEYFKNKLF